MRIVDEVACGDDIRAGRINIFNGRLKIPLTPGMDGKFREASDVDRKMVMVKAGTPSSERSGVIGEAAENAGSRSKYPGMKFLEAETSAGVLWPLIGEKSFA